MQSSDPDTIALATRLIIAREYVGLRQEDVALAMGLPRASICAIESSKRKVTGLELRRFARLYRRPVNWLLSEETPEIPDAIERVVASLSDADRQTVLRFAEFLAGAGRPNKPRRLPTHPPRLQDGRHLAGH